MSDRQVLEGHISVKAALLGKSREMDAIYISRDKQDRDTLDVQQLARKSGVSIEFVENERIGELANGKSHGGVIALVGERTCQDMKDLLRGKTLPFIAMLDGIEDPYNFGYAVRSLYAAGVDGLVVRPRNWMHAAGVVARSSAGASELLPLAIAETALDAATFFKEQGLTIACTEQRKQAVSIYDANLGVPLFLLIGGEKRGITRSLRDKADVLLEIPYGQHFDHSLSTDCAAAVLGFEIMRQRKYAKRH